MPRSADPDEDARRADALRASEKDLAEHAFVVDAIVHALKEVCVDVVPPTGPELLATDTVWHLASPITARLEDPATGPSALRLAQMLHPTPAVGGVPAAAAAEAIADLEGDLRDYFAGCVGWVDGSGDGVFAITIRAAVIDGARMRLFAGAGIVAGSDPDSEVRETGAKLETMTKGRRPALSLRESGQSARRIGPISRSGEFARNPPVRRHCSALDRAVWKDGLTRGEYSSAAFSSSRSAARPGRSGSVGRRLAAEETSGDRPTPITERLSVDVTTLEWTITFAVTIGVLLFDVVVIARDPREPTMKECAVALCFYVGAAVAFGAFIWLHHGHDYGIEFYAGWLTEYSLSIDNLFVFLILMAALKVPRKYQQEALLVGIILALVFRGIFIALGYTLIANFSWVFYIFGAFLVYTAVEARAELPRARGGAPRGQRRREVRAEPPQRRRRSITASSSGTTRTASAWSRRS